MRKDLIKYFYVLGIGFLLLGAMGWQVFASQLSKDVFTFFNANTLTKEFPSTKILSPSEYNTHASFQLKMLDIEEQAGEQLSFSEENDDDEFGSHLGALRTSVAGFLFYNNNISKAFNKHIACNLHAKWHILLCLFQI